MKIIIPVVLSASKNIAFLLVKKWRKSVQNFSRKLSPFLKNIVSWKTSLKFCSSFTIVEQRYVQQENLLWGLRLSRNRFTKTTFILEGCSKWKKNRKFWPKGVEYNIIVTFFPVSIYVYSNFCMKNVHNKPKFYAFFQSNIYCF